MLCCRELSEFGNFPFFWHLLDIINSVSPGEAKLHLSGAWISLQNFCLIFLLLISKPVLVFIEKYCLDNKVMDRENILICCLRKWANFLNYVGFHFGYVMTLGQKGYWILEKHCVRHVTAWWADDLITTARTRYSRYQLVVLDIFERCLCQWTCHG